MAKKKAADNWYQRLTPEQRRARLDRQKAARLAKQAGVKPHGRSGGGWAELTPEQRAERVARASETRRKRREERTAALAQKQANGNGSMLPVPFTRDPEPVPQTIHFPLEGFAQALEARAAAEPEAQQDMDFLADLAWALARRRPR